MTHRMRPDLVRPTTLVGLLLLGGCPPGGEDLASVTEPAAESTLTTSSGTSQGPGTTDFVPTTGTPTTGTMTTTPAPDTTGTTDAVGATDTTPGTTSEDGSSSTGTTGTDTTGEAIASTSTGSEDASSTGGLESGDTLPPPPPPPALYTIEVQITGLVGDDATFALNGQEQLAVDGPGAFAFSTTLEAGVAYDVALTGLPPHYHCDLTNAVGVMPMADVMVQAVCDPKPSATIVIAEVGFGYYANDSYWLEISNISAQTQSLAGMTVRAPAYALDANNNATDKGMQEFALPAMNLAAGAHLVVRGAITNETAAGPGMVLLSLPGTIIPHWNSSYGAIELRKAGESVDYIAWGVISPANIAAMAPMHPSACPDYPAGLPDGPPQTQESRARSLARLLALTDTNGVDDLALLEFSTPGGPNDTHGCVLDVDQDGLPDCAEAPGKAYAGVDLYTYGARPDKRDIFVELDAMNPKGGDGVTLDPGMVPQKAALDRIVAVFAQNDIALHFDVGDLFDLNAGIDPKDHDLGGGGQLPFSDRVCFDDEANCGWMVDLKAKNFALPRLKSFHYAVLANKNYLGKLGGQGERPGNDLYLGLGGKAFKTVTATDKNILINNQAQGLMHELGHNLGLSHGGFSTYKGDALADEANWKPNYMSIMNYLYNTGLPLIGANEGDRYYYEHEDELPACVAKGIDFCTMSRSMCGDPAQFGLDYSHGLGLNFDTAAVVETKGLLQPGSTGVDFDCDGVTEAQGYASKLFAAVDGMNVPLTVLKNHNDWANLDLFFFHRYSGFNNGQIYDPAARDIQPRAPIDSMPDAQIAWLRAR